MLCKAIKDLVLTDYLDQQLDGELKGNIESHLATCPDCAAFARDVQKTLADPFKSIVRQKVPERVWESIKANIPVKVSLADKVTGLLERITPVFSFPRLSPILAGVAVMLIVGATVFYGQQAKQVRVKEQVEYLAYLLTPADPQESENSSMETPIEKYFL